MTSSTTFVLITDANQGIGFEAAKNLLLSSAAYHVLLGSRDPSRGSEAVHALEALAIKGTVSPIQIDVTDDASIDAAAAHVEETYGRLDILVNNAGIFCKDLSARVAMRKISAGTIVGPISVTEAFLSLLRRSSAPRLIFVSSSVGFISQVADPKSKYYNPSANKYRASKDALNRLLVRYHAKLGKDGFCVLGADPGLIATNFINAEQVWKRGAAELDVGGKQFATVIRGDRYADLGSFCGEYGVSPW